MDPLGDALLTAGARGSLGNRIEAGGDWALWLDHFPGAALHVVTAGTVWLTVPGRLSWELQAGDVVLVPAATGHGLSHRPGVRMGDCDRGVAARARAAGDVMRLGSGPPSAGIITLHYHQDPEVRTPILQILDDVVRVHGEDAPHLQDVVRLLCGELSNPRVATTAALNSLVDLLLIQFIRSELDAHTGEDDIRLSSWLDPAVRDALARIHQRPEHPWTTATLAAAVNVSRATLSRRFPAATGCTPGAYLTRWRMDLAALRLRDTDDPVRIVAGAVGYTSVHAFSRAFHRDRDIAPGEYRDRLRATRYVRESPATVPDHSDEFSRPRAARTTETVTSGPGSAGAGRTHRAGRPAA